AVGRAVGGRRIGSTTHPESVDDHAGEGGAELSAGQNGVEDRGERAGRHSDEGVFGCGHSGVAAAASGPKKTAEQQNRSSRHRNLRTRRGRNSPTQRLAWPGDTGRAAGEDAAVDNSRPALVRPLGGQGRTRPDTRPAARGTTPRRTNAGRKHT